MIPAVSVLLKAYNHAAYIADSVASVLGQTFGDFELLIADDGSVDATPEIIRSFGDERIRFERSEINRGISTTMNGLRARARGEFVAFLNSDDVAMPDRLERQVAYLRAHPKVAAVFSIPRLIGEGGEPLDARGSPFVSPFETDAPRQAWLRHFFFEGNCLCAPSVTMRRNAYVAAGDDDPRLTNLQDLDRWVRLLERHEIRVVDDGLTAFRIRAGNANASAGRPDSVLRVVFEEFQILKRYRRFDPALLREIFARDLEEHGLDPDRPPGIWLAEIALHGRQAWHPLFALDTLHEAASTDADFARLRDLTGTLNVFRLPIETSG